MQQGPATYLTEREENRVFTDIGLWKDATVSVTGLAEPERLQALLVTDGTLPVLGVQPRWAACSRGPTIPRARPRR